MNSWRMLLLLCGCVLTLSPERLLAEDFIPKQSALRKEIKIDDKDDKIKAAILKLIPIGTSEAEAKNLFAKHMPSKERPTHQLREIPENLRNKKYTCFRLIEENTLSPLGTQWLEVLYFFEEGRLKEVYVAKWGVGL